MPADHLPPPTRRADAECHRDKILAVARSAFSDPAAEVSMAEIAQRAEVGMATLYRNFPGRRELLEALFADKVEAVCRAARTAAGQTPAAALTDRLRRFSLRHRQAPHRRRTAQAHRPRQPPVRRQPRPSDCRRVDRY
jgi:AcrR family transcriptional regulator